MKIVKNYYYCKVMVFLDEYNSSFIEAHIHEFYEDLRSNESFILHNLLKTSTSLRYAMLTEI